MSPLPPPPATPPALVTPPPRWRAQALDRLSIYLPVLLMGLLALGSYWLVRLAPVPEPIAAPRPVSHEPDYFMRDFAVRIYAVSGTLENELRGSELRHYPDTGGMEVDQARLRAHAATGQLTTAQARRLSTDAEQTQYQLTGEVRVVRQPPAGSHASRLEFQGEVLTLDLSRDLVSADQPVLLLRGPDRIRAERLRYDDRQQTADLQGQVRATLAPRP